jgi:hypothetical protein
VACVNAARGSTETSATESEACRKCLLEVMSFSLMNVSRVRPDELRGEPGRGVPVGARQVR